MRFFFSPKSRLTVSRPLAIGMNTLNILGPALLLCAVLLMLFAHAGQHPDAIRHLLLKATAALVAAALVIRIAWGLGIRLIAARQTRETPLAENKPKTSVPETE